jgi:hemerythrin HHE cation binding domain-containing protein
MSNEQAGGQTLVDEHRVLWHEIEVRRGEVLLALGDGEWPAAQLVRLVDYLRSELLDQAVNEERLLFPLTSGTQTDPGVGQLLEDHIDLRDATNALAGMATLPPDARDPAHVVSQLDDLCEVLDRHLAAEEKFLSGGSDWGVTARRRPFRPHQWYPLTEGPVVDADALPREAATDLVLERLSRLRSGEQVKIRSSARLHSLEGAFNRRGMTADYGWVVDEERPGRCRVSITRRPVD